MAKRFVSIWFRYLTTDWFTLRQPQLANKAFVLRSLSHGRRIITAANALAESEGIYTGMALADARVIIPSLEDLDDNPGLPDKLLKRIAEWCIRFSPYVAIDPPDGLILDVTGCSHLWGGDQLYLEEIIKRFKVHGYHTRVAIADTAGLAWAVARFGKKAFVIETGRNEEALVSLPPEALRLDADTVQQLHKL